jgi:hypothetical protein
MSTGEVLAGYVKGLVAALSSGGAESDDDAVAAAAAEDGPGGVQQRLARLVAEHAGALQNMTRSIKSRIAPDSVASVTAADLVALDIDLAEIAEAGVAPRELIESGVVTSLAEWRALGVDSFEVLLKDVGPPRRLRKWMGAAEWQSLVAEMRAARPPFWSPAIWRPLAAQLRPRDLEALGVNLDAWFANDPVLKEQMRKDPAWLHDFGPERWLKRAGLGAHTYSLIASVPKNTLI